MTTLRFSNRTMSPLRIALVGTWVPLPSRRHGPADYNLAIGYLQAYLQGRAEAEVFRKDFPLSLGATRLPAQAVDQVLAEDPHVVGLSSYCWDSDALEALATALKQRSPSLLVVLGGPTATFEADDLLRRCPAIDMAVIGEGEQPFLELVRTDFRLPSLIPGLRFRQGDQIHSTGAPAPTIDLSNLHSPYLSGVLRPPQAQLTLEWSRGCVQRCKHCAWKNFLGGLRHVDPTLVAQELRWALDKGYEGAFVLDAAINFDTSRLEMLSRAIAAVVPRDAFRFSYFLSQSHFEPAQLRALERLTAQEVWLGVESIQAAALKSLGRAPLDRRRFEQLLEELGALGPLHLSIMLGIPGDSLEGFQQTVDYLAELSERFPQGQIAEVRVFWTLAPAGSYFAAQRERLGLRTLPQGMPYVVESSSFPEAAMREAFRFLYEHPKRDLFVYDDPLPALAYPGLEDLRFHDNVLGIEAAGPQLPAEAWQRWIPHCRQGESLVREWVVRSLGLREGWPTLTLEKQRRKLLVQLRRHQKGSPFYVRAGDYDLLWVRGEGPGAPDTGGEPELALVMNYLAARVGKEPGS